jgi:hypothetical protein
LQSFDENVTLSVDVLTLVVFKGVGADKNGVVADLAEDRFEMRKVKR